MAPSGVVILNSGGGGSSFSGGSPFSSAPVDMSNSSILFSTGGGPAPASQRCPASTVRPSTCASLPCLSLVIWSLLYLWNVNACANEHEAHTPTPTRNSIMSTINARSRDRALSLLSTGPLPSTALQTSPRQSHRYCRAVEMSPTYM